MTVNDNASNLVKAFSEYIQLAADDDEWNKTTRSTLGRNVFF